jgi:hypothetical protein
VSGAAGGTSGGTIPAYNSSTGNIIFGFVENTVSQSVAINSALAAAGTGIQLLGYKYSWDINNDLNNSGGNRGTLTGNVTLTGSGNNILEQYSYNYSQTNTGSGFQNFSGTQLFTNQYQLSSVDKLTVSFTGKDQNWWAGYWGPRVHVNDVSLLYKVDPCATNPAYSSTCAGFNNVLTTNNLLNSSVGGASLNQAFAVNTALQNAGVGAMVHGFNYGFNWRVGQGFSGCTAWNQDGSCSWTMNIPAYANATVSLTNKNNQTIHQQNYSFSGAGTSGSVSDKFLLPTSLNQSMLGTGRIVGSASGTGSSIEGAWATLIYTADPCTNNPLYSPDCKGYAVAIAKSLAPPSAETTVAVAEPTQNMSPATSSNQNQLSNDSQSIPASDTSQTVTAPGSNNTRAGASMSMIMSVLRTESSRVGSVERSAVAAAVAGAEAAGTQATQQAEAVAESQTSQSIADSLTSSGSTGLSSTNVANQSQSSIFSLMDQTQSAALNSSVLRLSTQSNGTTETVSTLYTTGSSTVSVGLSAPIRASVEVEVSQSEGIKPGERSVLNDSIEARPLQQVTQPRQTDTVNKNAQSNELAGGVDIAAINRQPVGFQNYSFMLTDAQFYAPKEIYRNQINVDNARALRQLSSDRLHQQLIEQQYRR